MNRIKSFEGTSILYVIATPIGNLKEFSPRAIEAIKEADYIASEDTRTTSSLLANFGLSKPSISYHEHNEQEASTKIISLLKNGKKIALTSDAGYPGISDPGEILIRHCIEENIPVSIINGSNAFVPALVGSGLDTTHFYFHGFLDSRNSLKRKELELLKNKKETMIFYESPHRIIETLTDMYEILGDRRVSLAREITKLHEEYIRGLLSELKEIDATTLKGEMVVVVEGNKEFKMLTDDDIINIIKQELASGKTKKDVIKEVSEQYSLKKNYVYGLANTIKE